jgi:hypothetical protein
LTTTTIEKKRLSLKAKRKYVVTPKKEKGKEKYVIALCKQKVNTDFRTPLTPKSLPIRFHIKTPMKSREEGQFNSSSKLTECSRS